MGNIVCLICKWKHEWNSRHSFTFYYFALTQLPSRINHVKLAAVQDISVLAYVCAYNVIVVIPLQRTTVVCVKLRSKCKHVLIMFLSFQGDSYKRCIKMLV